MLTERKSLAWDSVKVKYNDASISCRSSRDNVKITNDDNHLIDLNAVVTL